jgi:uncharacterized protein YndB with AHSA1/START domain
VIQGQSVVHEVTYPYPPERVWRALVDPDELAAWLMPNDFVPVVGRHFTMSCDPYGTIDTELLELEPPRRIAYRWIASFGETLVTMELTPTDGGTRLRVERHNGLEGGRCWDVDRRLACAWPLPFYRPGAWLVVSPPRCRSRRSWP